MTKVHGAAGLPPETIRFTLRGSAGQSFGAWLAPGVELTLIGDANDYTGKGLSGGVLAVRPPEDATFEAEENVIIGNTVLYGATAGRAFFRGLAGERFAVRNSGAERRRRGRRRPRLRVHDRRARGRARAAPGRNFAAGMSGGVAYVLDEDGAFARALQHGARRLRRDRGVRRDRAARADRGAPPAHRLAGRGAHPARLGRLRCRGS